MLQEDEYKNLRDKLNQLEAKAPDFGELFGDEILGEATLRSVCQSKLEGHTEPAPAFDDLFRGETLGKPVLIPKRHLSPAWAVFAAAAACLGLFLLLPDRMKLPTEQPTLTQQQELPAIRSIQKKTSVRKVTETGIATVLQKSTVKMQVPVDKPRAVAVHEIVVQNFSETSEEENSIRDTSAGTNTSTIAPKAQGNLAVSGYRSLDEAYAAAKALKIKTKKKKDPLSMGANINGANRLLSQMNTNPADMAFSPSSLSYTEGYSTLEGSTAVPNPAQLRAGTSSENEWAAPENISPSVLQNFGAHYSMPVNLGFQVSIPLLSGLNLLTGFNYSYMSGVVSGNTLSGQFQLSQKLHYVGVPIKVSFNILKRGDFHVYAAGGGMLEKGLAGVQHCQVDGQDDWNNTQSIRGVQPSLTGQFGAGYLLGKSFSVYFEPGISWYIPSDQPISSRTEEPVNFNLSFGFRYLLQ